MSIVYILHDTKRKYTTATRKNNTRRERQLHEQFPKSAPFLLVKELQEGSSI